MFRPESLVACQHPVLLLVSNNVHTVLASANPCDKIYCNCFATPVEAQNIIYNPGGNPGGHNNDLI
jgi:hypothetical protein